MRFAGFLFCVLLATPSFGQDLARAEALLKNGKAEEAWKLLEPHEFASAGREEFDYLLGVAALESGRADRATLIFERVLAVNPNHAAARLDIGRAYYALGDYERARTELQSVKAYDPPAPARATVERYLAAIDERTKPAALRLTGYVEASAGYDSNVNAATSQSQLFVPLFNATFTLAGTSTRQGDNFGSLAGGVELVFPLAGGFSLIGGADARQRTYLSESAFNQFTLDVRGGVQYANERDTVRATFGQNRYELENEYYRRSLNSAVEWRRQVDPRLFFTVFGQEARIRYVQAATRAESSNLLIGGIGAGYTLDPEARSVVFGSVLRGADTATDGRADGDRRFYGGRVGMQRGLIGAVDGFAAVGYQKSSYEATNVIFSTVRSDRQYDLSLGVNWPLDRDWSVRPQLSWTRNDSNIPTSDYERYELFVSVRRDWR